MCRCKKQPIFDEIGDWDVEKNNEVLAGTDLLRLEVEVSTNGFSISSFSKEANTLIDFYPQYCPFCGRKLRNDLVINYFES